MWPQAHREMVDGGAVVVLKEPQRLPGGGVETGWGAVGRGQQEVDALSPAWLSSLLPLPPALPVPSQGRPFPGAPWRGRARDQASRLAEGPRPSNPACHLEGIRPGAGRQSWVIWSCSACGAGTDGTTSQTDMLTCFLFVYRTLVCAGLVMQLGRMVWRGDGGDATPSGLEGDQTP